MFFSFMILWDTCKSVRECLTLMILICHTVGRRIWCCPNLTWWTMWVERHCWLMWFVHLFIFLFWTLRFWLWAGYWSSRCMCISTWFLLLPLTNNSSNLIEFRCFKFLHDHLKLWLLDKNSKLIEAFGAALNLFNSIMNSKFTYQMSKVNVYLILNVEVLLCCVDSSNGLEGLIELTHLWIKKTQLQHILRQVEGNSIKLCYFGKSLEESERCGQTQIEIKREENLLLHIEDLICLISIISHKHKILKKWWIYLFILSNNQKSSDTNQLNLSFLYLMLAHVSVDDVYSEMESLW